MNLPPYLSRVRSSEVLDGAAIPVFQDCSQLVEIGPHRVHVLLELRIRNSGNLNQGEQQLATCAVWDDAHWIVNRPIGKIDIVVQHAKVVDCCEAECNPTKTGLGDPAG